MVPMQVNYNKAAMKTGYCTLRQIGLVSNVAGHINQVSRRQTQL